jgi:hypothetical protein
VAEQVKQQHCEHALDQHLQSWAAALGKARNLMHIQLDSCAFYPPADWAIIQGAGNAIRIKHPGPHPATCPLVHDQALNPALTKGSRAEGLQG